MNPSVAQQERIVTSKDVFGVLLVMLVLTLAIGSCACGMEVMANAQFSTLGVDQVGIVLRTDGSETGTIDRMRDTSQEQCQAADGTGCLQFGSAFEHHDLLRLTTGDLVSLRPVQKAVADRAGREIFIGANVNYKLVDASGQPLSDRDLFVLGSAAVKSLDIPAQSGQVFDAAPWREEAQKFLEIAVQAQAAAHTWKWNIEHEAQFTEAIQRQMALAASGAHLPAGVRVNIAGVGVDFGTLDDQGQVVSSIPQDIQTAVDADGRARQAVLHAQALRAASTRSGLAVSTLEAAQ